MTNNDKVFFTSDQHFGHANIIKFSKRTGFKDAAEMDDGLIERWNAKVPADGLVYHLGDLLFKCSAARATAILNQLNGRICLIQGNHDRWVKTKHLRDRLEWVQDYHELKLPDICPLRDPKAPYRQYAHGKQTIILCHYSFRTWKGQHRGTWHLYGHSHGNLPDIPTSRSFDVGVDCHNFAPISYAEVKAIIANKKPFVPIDHHGRD